MPNVDDVLRNNPDLARQVAGAAASAAGPGFGNFMNMAMGGQQQQPPSQPFNVASSAMRNTPATVASVEPPSEQVRREMKGPTGVDDILKSFVDARNDSFIVPETISSVNQPASAAAVELQSLHSEELMSQAESTRTGRGGGRRRRAPVGNSISIPV
jgi:membrane carboxypeptidase/penicillin-binding protein